MPSVLSVRVELCLRGVFSLRTASRTPRRSSTSCFSSSQPPCSQSASPHCSSITAGSSAGTDPLWVHCVLHTCVWLLSASRVCAEYLLPDCLHQWWTMFYCIFPPDRSAVIWRASLDHYQTEQFLIMCAQRNTLSLCIEESGLSTGVCYSVMQRHKAPSSKQLSNGHC